MSLAWFPIMGSSASVAVTWATVVPVGGGGVEGGGRGGADHTVRVSSGSSSSRRGNKVIMPQSRRVCLSGSGGGAVEMEGGGGWRGEGFRGGMLTKGARAEGEVGVIAVGGGGVGLSQLSKAVQVCVTASPAL